MSDALVATPRSTSKFTSKQVEMEAASTAATGTLLPCVRQKASNRHAWLQWVVKGPPPFFFMEMESTRRCTNLTPVCEETNTLEMENVTKAVERSIGDELPEQFGGILDGWTDGSEHYLAAHAFYDRNGVRHCPLLSMAPIINGPDECLNVEYHMSALASFLPFIGKNLSNVMFLVDDICAVNKRLARLMGVPLVGCASNRLNLAVRRFLEPYEKELEQVQSLMKRLQTINQAAKLKLRLKLRQNTRWESTYTMMTRHLVLREFIRADDEELAEEMPSPATNRNLKALLGQLADAQSVAMKLLSPNAEIVHSPDFESGVVKVLGAQAKMLTRAERSSLQPFLRRAPPPVRQEELAKVGFADRILNGARMARMVLRYERNRLSPLTLKMTLFLKVNQKYWDVTTVDECI
ncbi:hypothetical protein JG688_00018167 [Phytophthora aleatoria]|uniref:Uncharacterized protein n=1 Tax=Phytophthora aleatoria TaxID=2496075 RepID=A0A8J5IBC6_9STRA|nr:hypothetical protein JG688_00018167 [Phytophthora aleatoria]